MDMSPLPTAHPNTHIVCPDANFSEEALILRSLVEKIPKLAPLLQEFLARSEASLQSLHPFDELCYV